MIPHFYNQLKSSFVLWLNHYLCQVGSGFYNIGSNFYPNNQIYNGLYTYSSPFNQFVSSVHVSGATVPTGVYINGNFVNIGQSGFAGYDYENGRVYFSGQLPTNTVVSGNYAIKDFNIVLTNEPEEKLLFETQLFPRNKISKTPTGLLNNQLSYPIIFVAGRRTENESFAFGGTFCTNSKLSLIIFSENQFKLDSFIGLMADSKNGLIPLINSNEMPFDSYGKYLNNIPFNYQTVAASKIPTNQTSFIKKVQHVEFSQKINTEIKNINPEAHVALIDVYLDTIRHK